MTTDEAPIVVTGAASGIGAALADLLRSAGRTVVGLDRVAGEGTIGCDLADPHSIASAVRDLPATLGGLANVAGVPGTAPPLTVLAVNVLAPRLLTSALADRLAPGSAVVCVASVAAHRNAQPAEAVRELIGCPDLACLRRWLGEHPLEGPAAYDTSKRALVDWTRELAAAMVSRDVRALSVSPGPVQTPILGDFITSMGAAAIGRAETLVGRHARAEEIAEVVAFALSPAASWLNGVDILVDGGLMALRSTTTT